MAFLNLFLVVLATSLVVVLPMICIIILIIHFEKVYIFFRKKEQEGEDYEH